MTDLPAAPDPQTQARRERAMAELTEARDNYSRPEGYSKGRRGSSS
ncbi:hypothetical protein [Deinococcus radiophilus]